MEETKIIPLLTKAPPTTQQKVVTATDLIRQCNEAASKMSTGNDNRVLLLNCAYAIRQLVDRLAMHEGERVS